LGFTDSFDPSGEYHGFAWAIYSNLLLRTLVTYRHVEGPDGAVLVPDLATELPEPADGGLTYTFHLKHNIRFGPPLSRGIRSRDIAYAFERIGDPRVAAQYGFYYINLIKGMKSFNYGHSDHISGIETPDDRTIVFHLKRATGDFLYRVSMPATAPIPRKVAHCFRSAGDYGRFVIASGPYMLEGSEDLDIGHGCEGMRRISGYDPSKRITMSLVRNPDYDTRTDDREIRENLVDRVEFRSYENTNQMFRHIEHGKLESAAYEPRPKRIRRYENHPELNATLQSSHLDRTWYLTMNLTQPPFDDVHVRKAVNLVIDKAAIRDKWGGDFAGRVATHILPPDMTTGHPDASEYDPYPSPGSGGDVDAAREEMKQSRYDTDDDGLCDADECHEVLALSRNYDPWGAMDDGIVADLAKIGIDLRLRERADFYTPIQTVQKSIPIGLGPGWGKDYPDGHTFMPLLFGEEGLLCTGNTNYSLVGATPRTKKKCRASGDFSNVPSVQADIDTCDSTPVGDDRTACWVDLDKHLMEDVVPWVPYLWDDQISLVGPGVSKYEFDQFSGYFAFAHMAVDKTRQKGLAPGG
jgi:peptide/nickel transport system substrate-binding protein